MTINDVEVKIDFTDADTLERIEIGSKKTHEEVEKLKNDIKEIPLAEGIRQECKILKDFLDYVLGEGTSEKVFGKKDSLQECVKAFEDIINERDKQYNTFINKISKYSPERANRQ